MMNEVKSFRWEEFISSHILQRSYKGVLSIGLGPIRGNG